MKSKLLFQFETFKKNHTTKKSKEAAKASPFYVVYHTQQKHLVHNG